MIVVVNASIYGTNGAVAYQVEYSDGCTVRAVEGVGIIRHEHLMGGIWVQIGKAYKVDHNKKRQAERIKMAAKEFLAN